jgi:hypothetical protein
MNEVTEKLLTHGEAAFAKALEYVEATESFIVEQAPMLVQEILAYNLAYSVFWCVFCVAVVSGVVWGGMQWFKAWKTHGDDIDLLFIPWMITGLVATAPLMGVFSHVLRILKITFAPRLFLLEQLRYLIG